VEIYDSVARLSGARRKETKLMGGAHTSAREERENVKDERCKPKRKTYFEGTPRARGLDGPTERGGGRRPRRVGSGKLGQLGQIAGEDSSKF
jgi:hypothetical protein